MSNLSTGATGGSSSCPYRGFFVTEILKQCLCGASITAKMSKSPRNPYYRYYCCSYASFKKLVDDPHIFKWVDEALVNEMEIMSTLFENPQSKIDDEIKEKMDALVQESECKIKKLMGIGLVLSFMACIGIIKLLE